MRTTENHSPDAVHDRSLLSGERIFTSDEFVDDRLARWLWSQTSDAYFTLEPSATLVRSKDLIRVSASDATRTTIVSAEELLSLGGERPIQSIDGIELSADETKLLMFTNSQRVWRHNTRGDYWVFDLQKRTLQRIGGNAGPTSLLFAKLSPDGEHVAYVWENNLYVQRLDSMSIAQLTFDGSAEIINGTSDWVNEEELAIRDAYRWSPDSQSIAFWQFNTTGVQRFHLIDNTRGPYPQITSFAYPKVGTTNSATRIGVVRIAAKEITWLGIPGDARQHYIPQMEWTPDGQQILIQQFNRLQNTLHVMLADPRSGATQTVFTETESTWLENDNPVRWIDDGQAFVWLSQRDGWQHAYRVSRDSEKGSDPDGAKYPKGRSGYRRQAPFSQRGISPITRGDFDVIQIEAINSKAGWLYFAASPDNPTQRYLHRVRLDGTGLERLSPTNQPGWHTYQISPDCKWATHTYSTFTSPPTIQLIRLEDHHSVRVLADNEKLRENLAKVQLPTSEFFRINIGDALELDAWCLKPPGFDPELQHHYPLVVHVYGEPHGQTVQDAWQGKRGLWHQMLAQQGYVVVSIDNRGTKSPRGREWRKCVYRKIGIIAAEEQAIAVRSLLEQWSFIDPKRIGVWGWSGGGSMSLNAIFRYPELYNTAIAVAPNANQLLYDSIYQERYMGLPEDNVDGYRLGSPITYANQLEGNLLIVHGTGDDNGHYQGTEYLMNELVAHNKQFSVMPYPARSHSLSEGRNTELHFYSLMTEFLNRHLQRP